MRIGKHSPWIDFLRHRGLRRFTVVWLVGFAVVCLLAGIEGLLYWKSGFRYECNEAYSDVWIPKHALAVDSSAQWIAARMYARRNDPTMGCAVDAVSIDLGQQKSTSLQLAGLRPHSVALSPSGDWMAVSCLDQTLFATKHPAAGERKMPLESVDDVIEILKFSPDERYLAGVGSNHIYVWDWPSGKLRWRAPNDQTTRAIVEFSSDSSTLLCSRTETQLCDWNIQSGYKIRDYSIGKRNCLDAAWSDDHEDWFFVLEEQEGVSVRLAADLGQAQSVQLFEEARVGPGLAVALSSRSIAFVPKFESRKIRLYSILGEGFECEFAVGESTLMGVTFASDDILIAWDQQGIIWQFDIPRRELTRSIAVSEHWKRSAGAIAGRFEWLPKRRALDGGGSTVVASSDRF